MVRYSQGLHRDGPCLIPQGSGDSIEHPGRGFGDSRLYPLEVLGDDRDVPGIEREPRARRRDAVKPLRDRTGIGVPDRVEPGCDVTQVLAPSGAILHRNDHERDVRRMSHRRVDIHHRDRGGLRTQERAVEEELDADVRACKRTAARHSGRGEIAVELVLEVEEPALPVEDRVRVVVEPNPEPERTVGGFEPEPGHCREIGKRGSEQERRAGHAVNGHADRDVTDEVHNGRLHGRDDGGQRGTDLLAHHCIGERVERSGFGVEDHELGLVAQRDLRQRGRRIHTE